MIKRVGVYLSIWIAALLYLDHCTMSTTTINKKEKTTMNASPVQSTKHHTVSANVHKTVQTELKKFSFSLKQTTERRQLAIK